MALSLLFCIMRSAFPLMLILRTMRDAGGQAVFAREAVMSLSAIAGGSSQLANIQSNYQQVRNQFKQLGQDLQGGS